MQKRREFCRRSGVISGLFIFVTISVLSTSTALAATTFFEISNLVSGAGSGWGGNSGTVVEKVSQQYTPQSNQTLCTVYSKVARSSSFTTAIAILTVREGGSNGDSGTSLATVSLAASALPISSSPTQYTTFSLTDCVQLTQGTPYWFTFEAGPQIPYSVTFSNYAIAGRNTNEFSYSSAWRLNGSAFIGGRQWVELTNQEFSLKLEGSDTPLAKEPVIIVPGILGTELYNGSDLIWADLSEMLFDNNDEFLSDGLALNTEGNSVNQITVGKTIEVFANNVPFAEVNIFDGLRSILEENNYSSTTEFFFFPYDWRLDLDDSIAALNSKVEEVKDQTGFDKVNIIAHSIGGLLAKDYISIYGKVSVDKLIFVGTPHLGAPKAGKAILFGDRFGIPQLEEDAMRQIARNAPAVYQLLPNPKYFQQFAGYLKPDGYLPTAPPLDYFTSKTFIGLYGGNAGLVNNADAFFSRNLEDADLTGIKIYNFAGCKQGTQAGYQLSNGNSEVALVGYTSGDETVPLVSADYVSTTNKYYLRGVDHPELPSSEGVRNAILDILTDHPVVMFDDDIDTSSDICNFKGKELLWRSPVEVHVYDSQGNHTGPILNNAIEYNVPSIDYEIIGHKKFIFLPTDNGQQYRIESKGLENGSFDLLIRENENGNVIDATVFNDVNISSSSLIKLDISQSSEDTSIQLDQAGTGTFEIIEANATLSGEESDDTAGPNIVINSPENKEYSRSEIVPIKLDISDDLSGVATSSIILDGILKSSSTTLDLFFEKLGSHQFSVSADDRAGNLSEAAQNFSVYADATSTISNIERAFDLGWIKKKNIKNDLIRDLKAIIKLEKKIIKLESKIPIPNKPGRTQKIEKQIEKLVAKIDKILGKKFINELEKKYQKQLITVEAYTLLKEDVEWMMNN